MPLPSVNVFTPQQHAYVHKFLQKNNDGCIFLQACKGAILVGDAMRIYEGGDKSPVGSRENSFATHLRIMNSNRK